MKNKEIFYMAVALVVLCVIPEILVFGFDQGARSGWLKMLPFAIAAFFFWSASLVALCLGIYIAYELLKNKETDCLFISFSFALISLGVSLPCYWIKKIILDDIPAFGTNWNDIRSVVGPNTIVLGILSFLIGALIGMLVYSTICGIQKFREEMN